MKCENKASLPSWTVTPFGYLGFEMRASSLRASRGLDFPTHMAESTKPDRIYPPSADVIRENHVGSLLRGDPHFLRRFGPRINKHLSDMAYEPILFPLHSEGWLRLPLAPMSLHFESVSAVSSGTMGPPAR